MLRLGGDALGLAPCLPCWHPRPRKPRLGLLGVESPGDPACTGRLPAAMRRRFAEGWLGSPCPPPPLQGCRLAAPLCRFPPPGVGVPLVVPAVTPLWAFHPLLVLDRWRGGWVGLGWTFQTRKMQWTHQGKNCGSAGSGSIIGVLSAHSATTHPHGPSAAEVMLGGARSPTVHPSGHGMDSPSECASSTRSVLTGPRTFTGLPHGSGTAIVLGRGGAQGCIGREGTSEAAPEAVR